MHFWGWKLCLAKPTEETGAGMFCITILTFPYFSIAQVISVICHTSLAFQIDEIGGKVLVSVLHGSVFWYMERNQQNLSWYGVVIPFLSLKLLSSIKAVLTYFTRVSLCISVCKKNYLVVLCCYIWATENYWKTWVLKKKLTSLQFSALQFINSL